MWIFLLAACGAEIIGTMAGFGAATVLTPIAGFFMEIKTAVAIVACFHLFGNAWRLRFFGRHIRWRVVATFGLPGVAFSWAGAQAAAWIPAHAIRLALGLFLVGYAGLEAAHLTSLRLAATNVTLTGGGAVSGAIAGLIGTGGAIRSVCLLAFGLPKEAYLGTSAMLALLVDATRLPVYLTQQFIPPGFGLVVASLIVVAGLGAWIGQRWVRVISPRRFTQGVVILVGVMGVQLVWDGLRGIG